MKTFKKVAMVSALALTMITTTALPSMALSIGGISYEKAAKNYASSIEALVDQTGNSYEDATESYPENANENPDAPTEYVETTTGLGDNYLEEIFSLTSGFTKSIFGR
ncbi:MAG: hypothetical protein EOM05_04795 [Clostridia bacterium]|nr:hypothetical protein [Clostridia bacterium]